MAASDLAALQDVKEWLAAGGATLGNTDNNLISRLITAASGSIYSFLSRQVIIPQAVTERYDGYGNGRLLLRNYPALSISSLVVDGCLRTAGTYPTGTSSSPGSGWPPSGYVLSPWDGRLPGKPQSIDAYGSCGFQRGRQNVQVTYLCGYQVVGEAAVVPATPYQVAAQAPQGPWANDGGVVYASSGIALVAVSSAPAQGQYVPPAPGAGTDSTPSTYTFSAADEGVKVLITYGFVPAIINGACIEWVAERYRYRQRIGQKSQTVQTQQTASYDISGVPNYVKENLAPYRCVVPFGTWG